MKNLKFVLKYSRKKVIVLKNLDGDTLIKFKDGHWKGLNLYKTIMENKSIIYLSVYPSCYPIDDKALKELKWKYDYTMRELIIFNNSEDIPFLLKRIITEDLQRRDVVKAKIICDNIGQTISFEFINKLLPQK